MSTGTLRGATLAVACALVVASAAPAMAETPAPALDGLPGVLDADLSATEEQTLAALTDGGKVRLSAFVETADGAEVVSFQADDRTDAEKAVALLDAQPSVVAADVTGRAKVAGGSVPQYGNTMVRSEEARAEVGAAISDVVVAVLDTGVDPHPELQAALLAGHSTLPGWDPADTADVHGHGTHVAGTIGADAGSSVEGVAAGVRILPVKVLDDVGMGWWDWIASGVVWATDHDADVINMSIGGAYEDEVLGAAIAFARAHGVTVVAAAGNENSSAPSYPAAYPGVIGVSAVDDQRAKAGFSNHGDYVDLAAPGVGITSTFPSGELETWSGTSMASPHVAGVAALVTAVAPNLSPDDVELALEGSATDLGDPGRDDVYGRGLVDALAAVEAAEGLGSTGVWPGNHPPVATNRSYSSARTPDVLTTDVLAGASDPDGNRLEVSAFTQGTRGNVLRRGSKLAYEPFTSGPFTDTFTFTVHDGHGGRSTATATVKVGAPDPTDRAPVAKPTKQLLPFDAAPVALLVIYNNVSDPDHDPLRIVRVVQPVHGKVAVVDGDLVYTEKPGVWGTAVDTITWTVTDGRGRYATSTATISIRHPNADPLANDTEVQVGEGATYVDFTLDATDSEPDDNPFIRTLGTPAHGRATQLSDTRVRYTLTDDLPVGATDSFAYTVGDQWFGGASATVHVTVVAPRKPGAPKLGTVSPGKASAVVRWTAPTDPGNSAISGYVVRAYSHGTLVRSVTAASGAHSATVGGLTNGRAYTFRVAATNAFGTGSMTAASGSVTARTTPGAPKLGTVTPAHEALVVRWAAPTSDGGAPITGYVVRVYVGGGYVEKTVRVAASARSVTVRGLVPTGPCTVKVQAVNAAGGGALSASSGVVRAGR